MYHYPLKVTMCITLLVQDESVCTLYSPVLANEQGEKAGKQQVA